MDPDEAARIGYNKGYEDGYADHPRDRKPPLIRTVVSYNSSAVISGYTSSYDRGYEAGSYERNRGR